MEPEIKKKWIEALLSGEYEQGQNILRTSNDKFCCLGVLCDLYVKEGKGAWERYSEDWMMGGEWSVLPSKVMDWAGLSSSRGWEGRTDAGEYSSLTFMNDQGVSFEDIASKIAEEL